MSCFRIYRLFNCFLYFFPTRMCLMTFSKCRPGSVLRISFALIRDQSTIVFNVFNLEKSFTDIPQPHINQSVLKHHLRTYEKEFFYLHHAQRILVNIYSALIYQMKVFSTSVLHETFLSPHQYMGVTTLTSFTLQKPYKFIYNMRFLKKML